MDLFHTARQFGNQPTGIILQGAGHGKNILKRDRTDFLSHFQQASKIRLIYFRLQ